MHHAGRRQTLPSGPLVHRSAQREPCIHLDSLSCVYVHVCVRVPHVFMHGFIYLCIRGRVCVCVIAECSAPVCICVFILLDSRAPPAAAELVISRSGWRAMETNSTDVTSPPGWVPAENITATPLRDCLQ